MRLFIAEKPSLGRAIVACLPEPHKKEGDCIYCGQSDVVAWCAGHILELSPPEAYDPSYKEWRLNDLPIIPQEWQLSVTTPGLFNTIKKLVRQADTIVHAGDPDREGQLLVDEVLHQLGNTKPVQRILINDLNPSAVSKALGDIRSNADFAALSDSALARSRADWLYGLNMTRLYTILGRRGGYDSVLSVGRVQTPLLGLIVRRDREIMAFVPKPFYGITVKLQANDGQFFATWKADEAAGPFLDEDGRLLSLDYANRLAQHFRGAKALVEQVDTKLKTERQPLPFSLNGIQVAAAKRYDYSAKQVLDACQSLYETHRLTTYPRSDCSYLPVGHFDDAPAVIAAVKSGLPQFQQVPTDEAIKSPAWNDGKVTAHHAIIPTTSTLKAGVLSDIEANVYALIAERYITQFLPEHQYQETIVSLTCADELLTCKGKVITQKGWKSLDKGETDTGGAESLTVLPPLKSNDIANAIDAEVHAKRTTAPKPFDNETIVTAMSGIAKFVTNPQIKALLKESDGIGTPATQSQIIETLFTRGFIVKQRKAIVSTELGRFMIDVLPDTATTPDMTAFWESAMSRIVDGALTLDKFLDGVKNQLSLLISRGASQGRLSVPGYEIFDCPDDNCDGQFTKRKGGQGFFWGCSNFKSGCKETRPDKRGAPDWNPAKKPSAGGFTGRKKKPAKAGYTSRKVS